MPRSDKAWERWFAKRDAKTRAQRRRRGEKVKEPKPKLSYSELVQAHIIGEPAVYAEPERTSHIIRFAKNRRAAPTDAEAELDRILASLNDGVLVGKYVREHVVSGKWIVDFFFKELRLAIEVDGSIHDTKRQRQRDKLKDADCARFDITLIRITNQEVFGDRERLVDKLRDGWRLAKLRKNQLIGTRSPIPPSK